MSFVQGSHVSLSARPADGKEKQMKDGCGKMSETASAFFDPGTSSWRMSQASLLSEASESLERLPAWGMTANGGLFEHPTPGHLIAVRDGSASPPMLPTPRTSDTNGAGVHGDGGLDLRTAIQLLPTPRAQNGEPRNMKPWVRPLDEPQNLENAIGRLLPTPTARDYKDTGDLKKSVPDDDSLLPRAIAHHVTGTDTPEPSDAGN
jgi:hypothetical protein